MNRLLIILSAVILALGCAKTEPDYRNDDYGFAQFKLYKHASYGTRAVKPTLDYLAEDCKCKVTLGYAETTLAQTLTLYSVEGSAEEGRRSD